MLNNCIINSYFKGKLNHSLCQRDQTLVGIMYIKMQQHTLTNGSGNLNRSLLTRDRAHKIVIRIFWDPIDVVRLVDHEKRFWWLDGRDSLRDDGAPRFGSSFWCKVDIVFTHVNKGWPYPHVKINRSHSAVANPSWAISNNFKSAHLEISQICLLLRNKEMNSTIFLEFDHSGRCKF